MRSKGEDAVRFNPPDGLNGSEKSELISETNLTPGK
jgi:hypothetical protein